MTMNDADDDADDDDDDDDDSVSEYIESMPLSNTPEVFGLHPNAEINYYTSAAKEMWSHLMELQPQTGKSRFHFRIFQNPNNVLEI